MRRAGGPRPLASWPWPTCTPTPRPPRGALPLLRPCLMLLDAFSAHAPAPAARPPAAAAISALPALHGHAPWTPTHAAPQEERQGQGARGAALQPRHGAVPPRTGEGRGCAFCLVLRPCGMAPLLDRRLPAACAAEQAQLTAPEAPTATSTPLPWPAPAGCISAANGIGCILAELGNMPAAKEVFLQARCAGGSAVASARACRCRMHAPGVACRARNTAQSAAVAAINRAPPLPCARRLSRSRRRRRPARASGACPTLG